MDYQTLPLEERIERASEYALLLVADDKGADETIGELSSMFNLAPEEARQAYEKMRSEHAATYRQTVNKNNMVALTSAMFSGFFSLLYFFFGKGMMREGISTAMIVLAILFALPALGALGLVVRNWMELNGKQVAKDQPIRYLGSKGDKFTRRTALFVVFAALAILGFTCQYMTGHGKTEDTALASSAPRVLNKKPWEEQITDGGDRYFAYFFSFYEDPHLYRFDEKYFNYRTAQYYIDNLDAGDTLIIRYSRDDEGPMRQKSTSTIFQICNIVKNGEPYADLAARNRAVNKQNKNAIWRVTTFFVIIGGLLLLNQQFRRRKYKRLMAQRVAQHT